MSTIFYQECWSADKPRIFCLKLQNNIVKILIEKTTKICPKTTSRILDNYYQEQLNQCGNNWDWGETSWVMYFSKQGCLSVGNSSRPKKKIIIYMNVDYVFIKKNLVRIFIASNLNLKPFLKREVHSVPFCIYGWVRRFICEMLSFLWC